MTLRPLRSALAAWEPGTRRGLDALGAIRSRWPTIVGADVAAHAHAREISGDALVIVTASSAWSQQLAFLAPDILTTLGAIPEAEGIARLRFRVGALPASGGRPQSRRPASKRPGAQRSPDLAPVETLAGAIARFRDHVAERRRAKRAAGWNVCPTCGADFPPRSGAGPTRLCAPCEGSSREARLSSAARLMYEAPWLGYAATAKLVDGLTALEYEALRAQLLARWWDTLLKARRRKSVSREGRERMVASSFVLLQTRWEPDRITPAIVRNVLGDELHDLIYLRK